MEAWLEQDPVRSKRRSKTQQGNRLAVEHEAALHITDPEIDNTDGHNDIVETPDSWADCVDLHRRRRRSKTSSTSASPVLAATEVPSPAGSSQPPSTVASPAGLRADTDTHKHVEIGVWRKGAQLGSGSYGTVFKAQDADTGLIFAVKMMPIQDQGYPSKEETRYLDKLRMEVSICSSLRHPNIVSYLGHEYGDGHLCIFLEYVPGGSMSNILHEFGALSPRLLKVATRGSMTGLSYLHSRSPPVVHRDIKCANLLVDTDFCVKLADFGCSKKHADTQSFTTIGSIPWMAPEVISQADGHGRKADIWSMGCAVIEMATAQKPWGDGFFDNIMFALQHIGMTSALPAIPDDIGEDGHDFIMKCLNRAADQRPSAKELLLHPLVSSPCLVGAMGGA